MNEIDKKLEKYSDYTIRTMLKLCIHYDCLKKIGRTYEINQFLSVFNLSIDQDEHICIKNSEQETEITVKEACQKLRDYYEMIKDRPIKLKDERYILAEKNLQRLTQILQLNQTEYELLKLAFYVKQDPFLHEIFDDYPADSYIAKNIFATLFACSIQEIKQATRKREKLTRYGLFEHNKGYSSPDLADFISWGDTLDIEDFISVDLDKYTLLSQCITETKTPTLNLSHFKHISEYVDMWIDYLKQVTACKQKGVNILIYGQPGTGKTELATLLTQAINSECYTLNYQDDDGDTLSSSSRLEQCTLAQKLLDKQNAVVVFDEIEDVFGGAMFERSVAQENKAWMNNLLETNNVPIIWLSNDISSIDNAYLRRFDFIFEMPDLPIKYKENLIREQSNENLPENYIHYFAKCSALSPAIISRGLSVNQKIYQDKNKEQFVLKMLDWFNHCLQAQGKNKLTKLSPNKIEYNLDWVNCNDNIHKITDGLLKTKRGRICCYGPAGTGKTAWANWLAEKLEMPILIQQGSDLIDKFVGGTEQKIAEAFKMATENEMVLVFDEVDSFLFSREGANQSWERSMVNEMLTQIEKFEGLLVVSTNLLDMLDLAVLRRFDLKLNFNYLNREQLCDLAKHHAQKLDLELAEKDFMRLAKINNLTLGDFASVGRRHSFSPYEIADEWLNALEEESKLKKGKNSNSIGFV